MFRSFTSLSFLQIINYLVPILTFPYLLQTLGPNNYGVVVFSGAIASYFAYLIDLGFNYSANQKIALINDKQAISTLFSSVLIIKLITSVISFLLLGGILFFLQISSFQYTVILYSVFITICNSLYPTWFFLGKELTHYSTLIIAPIRIITLILIFSFVVDRDSVLILMQLYSSVSFLIMFISTLFAMRWYRIRIIIPEMNILKNEFLDSFRIFKGIGAISLYTASNNLILGIITNNAMVGIFNAADKIRIAFQSGVTIVGQSLFPQVARNIKKNKENVINELIGFMFLGSIVVLMFSSLAYILSRDIILLIAGKDYFGAIKIFKILCFIPLSVFISNILGIQIMINLDLKNEFNIIIWCGGLLNIMMLILLIPLFSVLGVAFTVLITESFISLTMLIFLYKRGEIGNV